MEQQNNRKKYLLIGGVIAFALILLLMILFLSSGGVSTERYKTVRLGFAANNSYFTKGDTVRFFNGRNVIDYRVPDGTSKALLPNDIPFPYAIQELSWSKDGSKLVFNAQNYLSFPELAQKILAANPSADITQKYWWAIDVNAGTISPVATNLPNVQKMFWKGQDLYAGVSNEPSSESNLFPSSPSLYVINMANGSAKKVVSDPGMDVDFVYDTDTSEVFMNAFKSNHSELIKINGDTQDKLASTTANIFDITKNNKNFLWIEEGEHSHEEEEGEDAGDVNAKTGTLHVADIQTKKEVFSEETSLTNPHFDSTGRYVLYDETSFDTKDIVRYDLTNKDKLIYKIPTPETGLINCTLPQGEYTFQYMYRLCDNGLFVFMPHNSESITIPAFTLPELPTNETYAKGFGINQDEDNSLEVSFYGKKNTPENRRTVIEYLQSKEYDPNLVVIYFSEND